MKFCSETLTGPLENAAQTKECEKVKIFWFSGIFSQFHLNNDCKSRPSASFYFSKDLFYNNMLSI